MTIEEASKKYNIPIHILKEYENKAKAITEQEKRFHALKRIDDITKNL